MSTGVSLEESEGEGAKELSCFTSEVELPSSFTIAAALFVSPSSPQGLKIPPCCPTAFRPPRAMLGDIIHWSLHATLADFVQLKKTYIVQNFREQPIQAPKSDCVESSRPLAPTPASDSVRRAPIGWGRARERPTVVRNPLMPPPVPPYSTVPILL